MKYILFVFIICFIRFYSHAQTVKYSCINLTNIDTSNPQFKNIVFKLDSFYARKVSSGFSGQVLIGYKGNIIYERYYGYANKERNRVINEHSPSQLASTSKPITAIAIALLKDRGLLNFDDSVNRFIPAFPYKGITIRHLLTHRSGLPEYFNFAMQAILPATDSLMSNDSLVQYIIHKQPKTVRPPDTRFKYCNTNYALLSYIVSTISRQSFATFVQQNIFKPLGMADSYVFNHAAHHPDNYCKNYKGNWAIQKDMRLDGITGDKSVYSTVRDLFKLDQCLYGNKLVKQATLNEMYNPYSFERVSYQNYGLGWRMFNYPDQKIIFHNGYWHGNNNCFYRFLADNFTIIILGNKFNKNIYAHPQSIYNIINNTAVPENFISVTEE
jgi:CubicO group peptidase (beta-lactamase class C family)